MRMRMKMRMRMRISEPIQNSTFVNQTPKNSGHKF